MHRKEIGDKLRVLLGQAKPFSCKTGRREKQLIEDVTAAIKDFSNYRDAISIGQEKLQGRSGITWQVDLVVRYQNNIYAIIECKNTHSNKRPTNIQAINRAVVPLFDLANHNALRFLIIRKLIEERYNRLFQNINAEIINWEDDTEWYNRFVAAIDSRIDVLRNRN